MEMQDKPEQRIVQELDPNERKVLESYNSIEGVDDLFTTRIKDVEVVEPRRDHRRYEGQNVPALRVTIDSDPTELAVQHEEALPTQDGHETELVWSHSLRADNEFENGPPQASWPRIEGKENVPGDPFPKGGPAENMIMPQNFANEEGEFQVIIPMRRIDTSKMTLTENLRVTPSGVRDNEAHPPKQFNRFLGTITLERHPDGSVDIIAENFNESEPSALPN